VVEPTTLENWFDPEGPQNIGNKYRDIWKGLFKAPTTGSYIFHISGDDFSEILIDYTTPFSDTTATYSPI
jgi:hypothetical protein